MPIELQAQEGPCLDAFRAGQPVEHENLRAGFARWPSFSTAALKASFQSVVALPLRLRDATLGALNLLSVRQTPMVEADIIVGPGVRGPRHRQHRAAPYRHRSPAHERAALRRPD
jgi:GAF domain